MTNPVLMILMQRADAGLLLTTVLSSVIIAEADISLNRMVRASTYFVSATSFAQAMWLLGFWIPSAAGYPFPRFALDLAFALAFSIRAMTILVRRYPIPRYQDWARAKKSDPELY